MKSTLYEDVMELTTPLKDIECKIEQMNSSIIRMETVVQRLDHTLTGNGQPGLITKFNQYEGVLDFVKWGLGGSVLINIGLVIMMFVKGAP